MLSTCHAAVVNMSKNYEKLWGRKLLMKGFQRELSKIEFR